jgi:hypothetical protein
MAPMSHLTEAGRVRAVGLISKDLSVVAHPLRGRCAMPHVACQNISVSMLPAVSFPIASRRARGRGGSEGVLDCDLHGVVDFA